MNENKKQTALSVEQLRAQLSRREEEYRNLSEELNRLKTCVLPRQEQENREIVLVNRILRVFAETRNDDELFGQVLDIMLEGLNSRHGVFGYISKSGHLTCPSLSKMLAECEVADKCIHYPPEKWKGLWARALLERRTLFTNEPSMVPDGHPSIDNNLAAPICFREEVIGLLNLANKPGGYTDADGSLVEAMAERVAPLLYAWIQKKMRDEERAEAEIRQRRSEQRVRRKLESVLSPQGDLGELELADLIDIPALQSLIDDFYALTGIPVGIFDVKGRTLVGVGWQEICIRFHRRHPESLRHCRESDNKLSAGLAQGANRLYKCKNNLWDMATPIIVDGRHLGNIFTGQFFYDDETVDRDLFREQARRHGFDEKEYLAALDRVPRLSRKSVDKGTAFLLKLADTLSQLSYSNAKLARLLFERERLTDSLQQSRNKLATALASMTDAVLIADSEGKFIEFNEAFAKFHRFQDKTDCPRSLAGYTELMDVFTPDGEAVAPDRRVIARALGGETVSNAEFTLRRKDTGETWIGNYSFGPIRNADGSVDGAVVVGRDVTERKRTEEALRQLNESLEQKVAERTELAEARSKQLQSLAVELIEAEERERRRIAHLLHDDLQQMLAAARMQLLSITGDPAADPALTHAGQIIEEAIAKSRRLSHELSPPMLHHAGLLPGLQWLFEKMKEQFDLTVALDTRAEKQFENPLLKVFLFRAVQELLFNTVKYAGVSTARVVLRGGDGNLVITVSDEGRGFDPAILDRTDPKTGLGLLSLRERARHIGGDLEIDSTPGKGSRFTLKVPLKLSGAVEPQIPADQRRPAEPVDSAATFAGTRVLLADDHKVMRQGLIQLISGQPDIQVVGEAASGREALEQARALRPDVILMDVSMPEMGGIEATRRIKLEFPEIRIIGLSMFEETYIADIMCEAGAETLLAKTVSSAEILKKIYGLAGEDTAGN